jgi:hypothetical protein
MSKSKSPTPPPDSSPLAPDAKAGVPSAPLAVEPMPVERNTEAIHALSNAPPYLLSRAETMFGAYNHFMGGNSAPFHNLTVTERAAWLAVARSVGS